MCRCGGDPDTGTCCNSAPRCSAPSDNPVKNVIFLPRRCFCVFGMSSSPKSRAATVTAQKDAKKVTINRPLGSKYLYGKSAWFSTRNAALYSISLSRLLCLRCVQRFCRCCYICCDSAADRSRPLPQTTNSVSAYASLLRTSQSAVRS